LHEMNEERRKKLNDILLFAGVLIIGFILFFALNTMKSEGKQVLVIANGQVTESFPLDENKEVMLEFDGYNLLVIEDGYAFVTRADCPDKLCMKQRKISKDGETIICLPHRLIIKISEDSGR